MAGLGWGRCPKRREFGLLCKNLWLSDLLYIYWDKNAIGGQEEPAAVGIQPFGTDCASALKCQGFGGGGAGGRGERLRAE